MRYYEVNKVTGEKTLIPSDDIITVTDKYLLVRPSDSNAAAKMVANYVVTDDTDENVSLDLSTLSTSLSPEESDNGVTKYTYTIGIEEANIQHRLPLSVCGFITDEINIGTCSYIELSVSRNNSFVPIEYYIVDGINEVPILPIEETTVENEKLFWGQKTRFDIADTVVIKQNGINTTMSIDDFLELDEINDTDSYTISYTPVSNSNIYRPVNTTIKIKLIERCKDMIPSVINSITIKKHGGKQPWTI